MRMNKIKKTMVIDGNEAAAYVAYAFTEVAAILSLIHIFCTIPTMKIRRCLIPLK